MNEFQDIIKAYLDKRAAEDSQFAEAYKKKDKSIKDCCNYILQQARKRGSAVFMRDEEVYGLAVHYYDENIDPNECRPVSGAQVSAPNTTIELTAEEKAKAKELAIAKYRDEQVKAIRAKERAKKAEKAKKDKERREKFEAQQLSLFD